MVPVLRTPANTNRPSAELRSHGSRPPNPPYREVVLCGRRRQHEDGWPEHPPAQRRGASLRHRPACGELGLGIPGGACYGRDRRCGADPCKAKAIEESTSLADSLFGPRAARRRSSSLVLGPPAPGKSEALGARGIAGASSGPVDISED